MPLSCCFLAVLSSPRCCETVVGRRSVPVLFSEDPDCGVSFLPLLATFLTCVDAGKNPSFVTLPWMFVVFSCEFWWCGACPVLCFS